MDLAEIKADRSKEILVNRTVNLYKVKRGFQSQN